MYGIKFSIKIIVHNTNSQRNFTNTYCLYTRYKSKHIIAETNQESIESSFHSLFLLESREFSISHCTFLLFNCLNASIIKTCLFLLEKHYSYVKRKIYM